jgi:phosphonate transport system substrate-binding protein
MLTLTRRGLAAALVSLALVSPVLAQEWKAEYPELTIGISSGENETDAIARTQPYADYLSRELGVPVKIVRGTDYAAVIEAMRAGHVQFASVGPAAYALARKVMGDDIAPVAVTLDQEGNLGYFSVIAVRADSEYQSLEDIKGKSFAFADPNSTSGYAVPSYYLSTELNTSAADYFSEVAFSGGHEQSVMALVNGTFEAVATHWRNENAGRLDPHHLEVPGDPEHPGDDADHPAAGTAGRVQDRADGLSGKRPRRLCDLQQRHFERLCRSQARRLSRRDRHHRVQRRRAPQER